MTQGARPTWRPSPASWAGTAFYAACSVACVAVATVLVVWRWARKGMR